MAPLQEGPKRLAKRAVLSHRHQGLGRPGEPWTRGAAPCRAGKDSGEGQWRIPCQAKRTEASLMQAPDRERTGTCALRLGIVEVGIFARTEGGSAE